MLMNNPALELIPMKTAFSTSLRFATAVLIALGIFSAALQPAVAQTADPLDDSLSGDGDSSDPFSSNGGGQSGSVLDLIHRVTLGNVRSQSEYNSSQQENLGIEASDFRSRQLELLRQQNQSQPSTQEPTEALVDGN